MIIPNVTKSDAQLYKSLLSEFKPEWQVEIIEEDYNLYKLGFSRDTPCSLQLEITRMQISELHDEIMDMETEVYMYEDILEKPYENLSKEEQALKKEIEQLEKKYTKFAPLEGLCWYVFNMN